MTEKLSHYGSSGRVSMVDVGEKEITGRTATAHAFVVLSEAVLKALPQNAKGDPLEVARIAGIMAAKKTWELIPLCHQLPLTHVDVQCRITLGGVEVTATAATQARTGVEMEAMTAVTIAALTIYDMTKALDKGIAIRDVYLIEKTGGKSGTYRREAT
jgi:cyclic pyranopterin phosphate synthase